MPNPNDPWLESSDVMSMFPTLVWKLQLKAEFHQPIDERILAALRREGLPAPAGADSINFHDPRTQTGIIRPPVTELTAENTDQVVVRVKNGTLLLFPAYLQHSVDANAGEEPRISISFNVMFSGFAENLSKPLW